MLDKKGGGGGWGQYKDFYGVLWIGEPGAWKRSNKRTSIHQFQSELYEAS